MRNGQIGDVVHANNALKTPQLDSLFFLLLRRSRLVVLRDIVLIYEINDLVVLFFVFGIRAEDSRGAAYLLQGLPGGRGAFGRCGWLLWRS